MRLLNFATLLWVLYACGSPELPEGQSSPMIRIFPNPAQSDVYINIQNTESTPYRIIVVSPDGEEIRKETLDPGGDGAYLIDISRKPDGYYFVIVATAGKEYVKKFVKR